MTTDLKRTETKIDGYEVSLEVWTECGEPRSECFIVRQTRTRCYSASLECLRDTGELTCTRDDLAVSVHQQTIDAIAKWAEDNGY